jgi:fructose/tagatose bisphosphate aldolase
MNLFSTPAELEEAVAASESARRAAGALAVTNGPRFRSEVVDGLVWTAVFGKPEARDAARRDIRQAAASLGILPASILPLYKARGRGEVSGFTAPAINIRMLSYDTARAAFRAARGLDAGAILFEIARSEIGYTDQRPAEYAAVVLAAAIREGWEGPVFLQGDHYQTNAKKMQADPKKEIAAIEALIDEAIPAGFFQIDIDTSTLVDLSRPTLPEQQAENARWCAHLTKFIRTRQPKGMLISVGGEIGEVGKANSTPEEFRAYMDAYLARLGQGIEGIAKVSVQTGSSHGGSVAADGTIRRVAIDFEVIRSIGKLAREGYGLAGVVQHGASTLPPELFDKFPESGCAEIHLATGFQNMVYEHPAFPQPLKRNMESWVFDKFGAERKRGESEAQFLYKNRKQAIGPFKESLWNLPEGTRQELRDALEKEFRFLFTKLKAAGTRDVVARHVRPVDVFPQAEAASGPRAEYVRDDEAGD